MDNKLTAYILRHSKQRDKELKYDFMPSLLEIIERPAHKAGTVIILGVFTLLIAAVVWACVSRTDVVITAPGSIQPVGSINVIKSYSGGTVKSINTAEGEYVKKGDVLIELDCDSLMIDIDQLRSQEKILLCQQEIYAKVKNNDDMTSVDVSSYDTELQPYVQSIIDSDTSNKNTVVSYEKEKDEASLNQQISEIQLEEYRESGTQRQAQSQELVVNQYKAAVEKADAQINYARAQYSLQINSQLSQINEKLEETQSNIKKYELSKNYQTVVSPVNGVVNSIAVNTTGETVTTAQELITIVPEGVDLEMVCYVKNMDIADVKPGMQAEIKLEAYPYNKYGTVKSRVKYISPSAFSNEKSGSVYLVKLEPEDVKDSIDIISGLSGSAEIKTGTRSVMDYFLDPIKKGFGESLKEK
ncbi:MAG: HlyD family efflux transporter periplasmic adaptor subunit [Oscillospiraceae bacterium]|nr:HlyD family efflux transporter periplasmic adaptor subunit [Oscillospiraceae bacterium]